MRPIELLATAMKNDCVTVCGAAITAFNRRKDGSSFRDWAFTAFEEALQLSTLERSDIDALFVASESDFFTFQLNPASILISDLGLIGAASMRTEGGGASGQLAVHAATRAIQSGHIKHAAVVGVDPSASHLSGKAVKTLYSYSFDAWTDGVTGVSSTALYALSLQHYMQRIPISDHHLAKLTIQNRENAIDNPRAHLGIAHSIDDVMSSPMIASPYRRLHCSPLSDGAAALILSASNATPTTRKTAAKICGIGAASDNPHLGARDDPGFFKAKQLAMKRACAAAEISPEQVGLAEVYDAYAGAQLQAIDALGLSQSLIYDLENDRFAPNGACPVNLSGGLMGQGAPVGATGVAQTASCALMLEGLYTEALQPKTPPRYAVADTHGGICTTAAVTLLQGMVS